ncbi:MAG: hypothetical protein Tsb009_03580 [Planctomycetaceae bacterium]
MNRLTSQQRKLVYFGAILVLAIPIIWLGMPGGPKGQASDGTAQTESVGGGKLAQLRNKYELGESNLGDVDPSSATMNLVLVGLRGIAVDLLWREANKNQETKNWAALKTNVESIILLQPHYMGVWQFQAWNLSYNVSAEWDLIGDKYYWLKEGAKFSIRGSKRNSKYPELFYWVGQILGEKLGRHDAWRYFRKFFNPGAYDASNDPLVGDPDLKRRTGKIGPDPELNPDDIDNYLVAKKWFHIANDKEKEERQHIMMKALFRQKPAQAQIGYAQALQREGRFDDIDLMSRAWQLANQELTTRYQNGKPGFGQEEFKFADVGVIRLDAETDEELKQLTLLDDPPGKFSIEAKRNAIEGIRKILNYRYWRTRTEVEQLKETIQAHRDLFKGKDALLKSNPTEAIRLLQAGLYNYANILIRYPVLKVEDSTVEEVMIGILAWQYAYKLIGQTPPEPVPAYQRDLNAFRTLKNLWLAHQPALETIRQTFNRELQVPE